METHYQRNTRSLWLMALAGLVVLVLITWWALGRSSWNPAPVIADADGDGLTPAAEALPAAVGAYVEFVGARQARDAMTVDHEFTATAIRNLAAALEAIATAGGPDVRRELTTVREQAAALQQDARSLEHADRARELFITVSGLMTAIQVAGFPSAAERVAEVKRAAEGIDPAIPLLEQPNAVQTFFDRAAGALRAMPSGGAA